MIKNLAFVFGLTLIWVATGGNGFAQQPEPACSGPKPVCDARASVFPISAFDPVASAVRIGPSTLVTTRHSVADEATVTVFTPDGDRVQAQVIPADYKGDIVLLNAPNLPPGPHLNPGTGEGFLGALYTVGADVTAGVIRAYPPGQVFLEPAVGFVLARLHHTAYSQPGNSGGALVDDNGTLVGIVASGGNGRFEAVPAASIADLENKSGPSFQVANDRLGTAVRTCTLLLEDLRGRRGPMEEKDASSLKSSCLATGNRQYFDDAAQAFGIRQDFERSIAMSEASLAQDPNALNGRIGLAVTYHLAGRYEEELEHLRVLTELLPDDPQVIRLSIQAGIWGGDKPFAEAALARLQATNPNMVQAARRFLDNPPPRPPRR